MYALYAAWEGVRDLMEQGGVVLYAIALLIFVMWTLILERLWYIKFCVASDVEAVRLAWETRQERSSRGAHLVREALISRVGEKIDQSMALIRAMVTLAPLFGLLGTVTGMISVFEVMGLSGGGDARAMSAGIARATIPTMSGMVAAIAGVFGQTYLERLASREKTLLADHLTMDH